MAPNYEDYRIMQERFGTGGSCYVHKAIAPDGRVVALKVPKEALADPEETLAPETIKAFQQEAELWKQLTGKRIPGIVRLHDHGLQANNVPWLAMEFMEGGDLRAWIRRLDFQSKIRIMKTLAQTLSIVHRLGIIHRDLKPGNILMTRDGEPRISDWGLGKVVLQSLYPSLKLHMSILYSAPEQFTMGVTDWSTDIYQFGAMSYELLTGRNVFPGDDPKRVMHAIINEMPAAPSEYNGEIPAYLDAILLRCIEKRKEDRYPSFDVVLYELEHGGTPRTVHPARSVTPAAVAGNERDREDDDFIPALERYLASLKKMQVATDEDERKVEAIRHYMTVGWEDHARKEGMVLLNTIKDRYRKQWDVLLDNVKELTDECISRRCNIEGLYDLNRKAIAAYKRGSLGESLDFFTRLIGELEALLKGPRREEEERRKREEEEKRIQELLHTATTVANAVEKQRAWAKKLGADIEFVSPSGIRFVLVPAGTFMMGSNQKDVGKPVHRVTLTKPFYLGKYPVTQKEWKTIMGKKFLGWNNPSYYKGDDLPVDNVSWDDCQGFIRNLNARESVTAYRLPTEAEWEYACRAGNAGEYCFGDNEGKLREYAWYDGNSGGKTHPVGQLKSNPWGLHDMHGNVWEWCQDWYGDYPKGDVTDPIGPSSGSFRVFRGGGWYAAAVSCRSVVRYYRDPGYRSGNLGFRLLRSL